MKFSVVKANIVNLNVDAIVLPANEQLREGSGASRAIFKSAGRMALTKACKEIGHCNMGSAVPTLGYNLKSKYCRNNALRICCVPLIGIRQQWI